MRATEYEDPLWQAARFIYLNKTCWNGLYRVNRQGEFNVPFGHNGRAVFEEEHVLEASRALRNATLRCSDFEQVLATVEEGDVVYLDPPYTVIHAKNGFRRYNEKLFGWDDQERLSRVAHNLVRRGCHVVVSNADNEDVRKLYGGFLYERVLRHSVLAANPRYRGATDEALFISPHLLMMAVRDWEGAKLL